MEATDLPIGAGGVDDAVTAALRAVDRRLFLPVMQRYAAHRDNPVTIGYGQTCSQPSTVSAMLRLLRVQRGGSVLDVGSGSGWTTALLAHLVGPDGEVLGVERIPELVAFGAQNLSRTHMSWARIIAAEPGTLGVTRPGGWPRILVSAAADELPNELVGELGTGGRMVIPVEHTMLLVERHEDGSVDVSEHGTYSFVPLITSPD